MEDTGENPVATMDTGQGPPAEAVAIIGMACRFPGGAHDPESFFANLERGESAWSEFPTDRLNIGGFYHPSAQRKDSFTFKGAHFLTGNIAAFDAEFFSMSATESSSTDVQQRILLEVAYEAVENAGIPKEALAGSDASVYIGSFVKDYEQVSMRDAQYLAADCATGNGIAIMSNRISYFFDIHGPSMTIDTGCSASLICIHQAVQSLLRGESSMAMAGGAGMILTPSTIMPMVSLGFLSRDGRCYTFDSRANGYGRGEGVGIVVLKRLSDAIRDNDTIRGVIRGTSTNQDGRTSGITMPSSEAQVLNIRKCYASAGLDFSKTMFVECHGTGTQAGDPRELKAISDAMCDGRSACFPMLVGSVKTNIGHLEGSAGVAGVIKAVMAIEKGRIPRHINFQSWNPNIDHRQLKVDIPRDNTKWPASGLRRISVNSFGFGGSNAHAVIDDAAHYLEQTHVVGNHNTTIAPADDDSDMDMSMDDEAEQDVLPHPYLYLFSANDQEGVFRVADAHLSRFLSTPDPESSVMRDYAYTLSNRRSRLQYKAFAVAGDYSALKSELSRVKQSQPLRSQTSRPPNVAFVFCGQGAQWPAMGLRLCIFEPFRESLKDSIALLQTVTVDRTFSLLDILTEAAVQEDRPEINIPIHAQPATTAIQIALVDLLTASGVKPTAVVGHSSGELAAAYAAGMVSKLGALTLAYFRGKAASHVSLKGSMLAVSLSSADVQSYLDTIGKGSVCVACVNSPRSVTLSGDTDYIKRIQEALNDDGIANKLLAVETAYHSPHMRTVSEEYHLLLKLYVRKRGQKKDAPVMFSSVTGQRISHADVTASYWVSNMASPVEFEKAVSAMLASEKAVRPDIFVEASPHSVLGKPLTEIVGSLAAGHEKTKISYFSMMNRNADGADTALKTLGELWARGLPVRLDWQYLEQSDAGRPKCLVDLPTYPWDHSRNYWHESHLSKAHRFRKFGSHDFLGAMTADSITPQEPRWRGFIDVAENPWIAHHKIQKKIMYPAAGMVVMAVEAAKQVVDGVVDSPSDIIDFEICDLKVVEPMIIPASETRLEYNFDSSKIEELTEERVTTWRYRFTIYTLGNTSSAPPYQHINNAAGFFAVRFKPRGLTETDGRATQVKLGDDGLGRRASGVPVSFAHGRKPREFYERLNMIGLDYGRLFRNLTAMSRPMQVPEAQSSKYCWTRVQIPNTKAAMPEQYETPATIHPATLDAMFQSLFVLGDQPMVPHLLKSVRISADMPQAAGAKFLGYSEAKRKGPREAVSDIIMWQGENRQHPVVDIRGLHVITMADTAKAIPDFLPDYRSLCSQIVWKEDPHHLDSTGSVEQGGAIIFKDESQLVTRSIPLEYFHDSGSRPPIFEKLVELMGHKIPSLCVLQIGGAPSVTSLVLDILGSGTTPRLSHYVIMGETEDVFQTALGEAAQNLRALLSYERLVDDALPQQRFDLVLADIRASIDKSSFMEVLNPTGILAFTHTNLSIFGPPDRETDQGEGEWMPTSWYSFPQAFPGNMLDKRVVILVRDQDLKVRRAHDIATGLMARLDYMDFELSVKQMTLSALRDFLDDEGPEHFDAYVISLLETSHDEDVVYGIGAEEYTTIQKLFQKMNKGLLWVTAGAQMDAQQPTNSPFLGWARTVRSEEPDKQIVCLDLEATNPNKRKRAGEVERAAIETVSDDVTAILDVFFSSFRSDTPVASQDVEFALRDGRIYIPRLEPLEDVNKLIEAGPDQETIVYEVPQYNRKGLKLVRGVSGAFEDVYFKEDPGAARELQPHEVLIEVQSCWLVPDDLAAVSEDHDQPGYQTDVWGTAVKVGTDVTRVSVGETVVAIGCGSIATKVIVDERFVWEEVDSSSAFMHSPTCLISASYCLRVVKKGDRVLIHGATGAHGQAAIHIASYRGAKVFAVVSSEDERKALVEEECLNRKRIFVGDASLPEKVAHATASRGMDLIFNPTAANREMDFGMVRPFGTIIHLVNSRSAQSSRDVPNTGCFQLKLFDFATFMERCPERVAEHCELVYWLSGSTIPGPFREQSYYFADVRTAFKDMEGSLHSWASRFRNTDYALLPFGRTPREQFPAPRLSYALTYVVAGGLGGLGKNVVQWLTDHGARHVVILTRKKISQSVETKGIRTTVVQADICDWDACSKVFKNLQRKFCVGGIIQAAAVVKDGIYQNLSYDDWKAVTRVKTVGSWNLHRAAEEFCPELDFFVFLSSAAGIIGNLGQANYNAGNSFQDALARHRSAHGMHTVSIDLGPVIGAGMVAEDEALWDQLRAGGFIGVRLEDFHAVLERAITKPEQAATICPPQVIMGVGTGGLLAQNKPANPFWASNPLFRFLNRVDVRPGSTVLSSESGSGQSAGLRSALKAASSRAEAAELLLPHFVRALGEVMGKNHAEIDPESILDDHGPDSLRMKEIVDWVSAATGVKVAGINQMPIRGICALVVDLGAFGGED